MNTRELLFPPGATRHDWVLDGMLALAMFLVTVLPYASYSAWNTTPRMLLMVTLSLMVLPLVLRRHSPLLMLAGCTFAGIVQVIVVNTFTATLVVLPIVAYSVARWVPGVAARSVVAIGGFASIIGPLRWATATQGFTISARGIVLFVLASFVCLGLIVTPYAIGRRVRESSVAHADRIAAAEERYQLLLAEREQQARLAESRARATIARELHDELGQLLTGIRMEVSWLGGRLLPEQQTLADKVLTVKGQIDRTIATVRRISSELRPLVLDDLGLSAAASWYVDQFSARTGLAVELSLPDVEPEHGDAVATALFRVLQESLTNVARHAQAEKVTVCLAFKNGVWSLSVSDDGLGFIPKPGEPGDIGLVGMRERAQNLGGRFSVTSAPEQGTRMIFTSAG